MSSALMNAIKKRIVFVTGNANKLKEVQAIMGESFDVISVSVDCTCAIFPLSTDVTQKDLKYNY